MRDYIIGPRSGAAGSASAGEGSERETRLRVDRGLLASMALAVYLGQQAEQEGDTMVVRSHMGAYIVSLQLCVGHREPMSSVESARVIVGFGIEGDRHATGEGVRAARQVLLMDEETLEAFGLVHGEVRENITTSGLDPTFLQEGQRLALGGQVVLQITGPCAPCARMDEIRPGLRQELDGRRGMLASVVRGGTIRAGDAIEVLEGAAAS